MVWNGAGVFEVIKGRKKYTVLNCNSLKIFITEANPLFTVYNSFCHQAPLGGAPCTGDDRSPIEINNKTVCRMLALVVAEKNKLTPLQWLKY